MPITLLYSTSKPLLSPQNYNHIILLLSLTIQKSLVVHILHIILPFVENTFLSPCGSKKFDRCPLPNCLESNQSIALGNLPAHDVIVITFHVPRNYFTFRVVHLVIIVHLAAAIVPLPVKVVCTVPANIMKPNVLYMPIL